LIATREEENRTKKKLTAFRKVPNGVKTGRRRGSNQRPNQSGKGDSQEGKTVLKEDIG